jgi:hypothetical protein
VSGEKSEKLRAKACLCLFCRPPNPALKRTRGEVWVYFLVLPATPLSSRVRLKGLDMKDWIPLLQELIWPTFIGLLIFRNTSWFKEVLDTIKERIGLTQNIFI